MEEAKRPLQKKIGMAELQDCKIAEWQRLQFAEFKNYRIAESSGAAGAANVRPMDN